MLAPSRAASFERATAAELMTLKDPRAQRRGRVLHAFLEQVGFSDDAEPDEATLLAAARRVEPAADDELLRAALGDFRRLLNHQAIRAALARPHPPGTPGSDAELWRERPFAVPVDGKLIRGTFDRVVIAPDQVTLIDFKTDTLPSGGGSGGPTALADLYRAQLDAYRVALARLLKLEPSAIRVRLVATAGPAVIDL